jgi:hypothetical protein
MSSPERNEFEKAAESAGNESLLGELWAFLRENKKWWLIPIFVALGLVALLALFSGSAIAPFIYSFF